MRSIRPSCPRAASLVKRLTLGRMRRIIELLQAGDYPNCRTIAADLEFSTKTAARDLDCMRDRLTLPIEYDGKHFGYHLSHHFCRCLAQDGVNSGLCPVCASVTFPCVTKSEPLQALQHEALKKLGRNVLHFQRLESQLKILVLFCDFQSPLRQFKANHKKRAECIRMKTMGTLVTELHQHLYGKPPDSQTAEAITEASLAIGFRIDPDPNSLSQRKQELNDLVIERNRLIHHDLAEFDPTSAESCQHWITRFDEQNTRMLAQLSTVQNLVNTCKQAFSVSGQSKPARDGQMKTSHFESGIAQVAAMAATMRDEPTHCEPATLYRHAGGQRLVVPEDRA